MIFLLYILYIVMGYIFGSLPIIGPIFLGFLVSSLNSHVKQKSRYQRIPKWLIHSFFGFNIVCFLTGISVGSFYSFGDESVKMGIDKMEMVYWQGGLFLLVYAFARMRVRNRAYEMSNGWNNEG